MKFCPSDSTLRQRFFILIVLLITVAACGGPGGAAAPTPLPPGEPIPQPTPLSAATTTPTPVPPMAVTEAIAEINENEEAKTTVNPVQALLATQIAIRVAEAGVVESTPTPAAPAPTVNRALAQSALTRPTSLGIVGGAGAGFLAAPGGAVIRSLTAGATVTITGRSGDGGWYAAYLEDGQAGWVASGAVRVFGEQELLQVVSESVSPVIVATMIAEASRPLGPIATPAQVTVNRAATATPTTVADTPADEGTPTPAPAAPPSGPQAVVIVDGLNVRAGPGTEFPIVGGLVRDVRMNLLGRNETGDWLQIETPEGRGWVFAQLVEAEVPVAELPVVGG